MAEPSYHYYLSPQRAPPSFLPGEEVFVKLNRDKDTGRAVVLQEKISDREHEYYGRVKVRYHDNDSTCHVRPAKMSKVCDNSVVLVCFKTAEYRRLSRSQVTESDFCLDIGCSYGKATEIIAQHCRNNVVGIDISEETIEFCKKEHQDIRFERLDCLQYPELLIQLAKGCTKVFIDIGGNRALPALLQILKVVQKELKPKLIVIKNEAMFKKAETHIKQNVDVNNPDRIPDPDLWLKELLEDADRSIQPAQANQGWREKLQTGSRFTLYPLKYPMRNAPDGKPICRFYNYGVCPRETPESACKWDHDHEHCHYCLQPGHIAKTCTAVL